MTLEIVEVAEPGAEWDDFVVLQRGWTFCHQAAWHRVVRRVFRHDCMYLAARSASAVVGVLPLVRVKSAVFGHFVVSMPFMSYGGPLGTDDAVRALAAAAASRAEIERATLLQLRSRVELPLDLPASHEKITVTLDISAGGPDVWKALDGKVRNQIRRPQKDGATVTFGPDQLDPFFHVFARNMRDLGTPTQSRAFFAAIRDAFRDQVWFGCVYLGGRPVAAGCGFRFGDEFEMTWASSLREFNRVSANMLLYWSFIERASVAGISRFNFGRCSPGSGPHRFKKQWGGVDEPLWWYFHPSRGAATRTPAPDRGVYAIAAKIWQQLPVPLATFLGPRIVRYIP